MMSVTTIDLTWHSKKDAENALHNQQEPDPASWRKFMLKKVKITSDSFQECDNYHLTSSVESSESNSDPEEGLLMRKRRKRLKKNLPDDFVSSEDLHEAAHMKPVSQKSAPSRVALPTAPPKVSLNMRSTRTHGMMVRSTAKDSVSNRRSKSSDISDGSDQHDRRHHDTPYQRRSHYQGDSPDQHDRRHHDTPYRRSHDPHDRRHHDTPYQRSHDPHDRRHHDTSYRRRNCDQSDSSDQYDRRHHDAPCRRRSHDQGDSPDQHDRRHHDTPYQRRSHYQGDSPDQHDRRHHDTPYRRSHDPHDRRHHDTSYRRRSCDQSDSSDQYDRRHHDAPCRRRSHDQGDSPDQHDRRHHDTPYQRTSHDQSDSPDQQERRHEKHYQNGSRDQYDWDNRRGKHNQRGSKSRCDPCNDNQKNHKGNQDDAESNFPLEQARFQKRVLQLLLEIRNAVSNMSTYGDKPADTACTLTIKRNNSLEEVQTLEDELVDPSCFMEMCNQCVRIGGYNKRNMVSNLMCRFMTKNLMCQYNMLGQRGKLPFRKTKLYNVIQESVLRKFSDSSVSEIQMIVAAKLRSAPKLKNEN